MLVRCLSQFRRASDELSLSTDSSAMWMACRRMAEQVFAAAVRNSVQSDGPRVRPRK